MLENDRRSAVPVVCLGLLAVLLMAVSPATASATTLVRQPIQELAASATSIVVAEVENISVRQAPSPRGGASMGGIETDVDLRVLQSIKGDPTSIERVTVAGGKIGDTGFRATWEPEFRLGERAILFLDGSGRVMGPQGKLAVADGRVPLLDEPLVDVLADMLGAEPLGPFSYGRTTYGFAAASLPSSGPSLRPQARLMPSATAVHIDDDFESGTIDPGVWHLFDGGLGTDWTISSRRKSSGAYSIYCDDDAPVGGPYTANSYSWIWAGPFDLSSATTAYLDYDAWLSFHSGDSLAVVFSTGDIDGDTHLDFNGFAYGFGTASWIAERIDLSDVPVTHQDLTGESQVWIAFIFTSDSTSNTREGAYLDDIRLLEDPVVPTITGITPGTASAGTGSVVTISGTGFGSAQESGHVDFTYDQLYGTTIQAPITAWSDTQIKCIVPIVTNPSAYPGAAGSGPVTVTNTGGGTSAGHAFSVPFAYGGIRWPTTDSPYRVNANTGDTTSELALFSSAASTWNAASAFQFDYLGTTTTNDYTENGVNEVFWTNTALPSNVLAAAGIWYDDSTMLIEEVDIGFNDLNKTWGNGSGGSYDIQTIAVHELGHALNLRDLYGNADSAKIMYGYGAPGGIKRDLSAGDIAGIQWIYSARTLSLQVTASPALAVPGEDVLFTYTVTNEADWPVTDVTLGDSFGLVSVTPTLAAESSLVQTRTVTYDSVGFQTNYISVDATGAGEPVQASASRTVEIALPSLNLTVLPTEDPARYGSDVTLRYRLSNSGRFPLSRLEVVDRSRGTTLTAPGPLQPGDTLTLSEVVTADRPTVVDASASGSYKSAVANHTASTLIVSTYERIAGADRIATAILASKRGFPASGSATTAVVASAFAWADALPASGLAGAARGPLLLVSPTTLSTSVRSELVRLGATKVYLAGGASTVSASVERAIDAMPGVEVERLGGADRYGTARLIANEMRSLPGVSLDTAFVATGRDFPDALAASSLAAAMPAPILLTDTDRLPSHTQNALSSLDPDTIVLCGGKTAVSTRVETALGAYGSVVRRGGNDRYHTARLVATWGEPALAPTGPTGFFLAVGTNYPDALAGGVLAARASGSWSPLLLTPKDSLSSQVSSYVASRPTIVHAGVLGSTSSISSQVLANAKSLLP